MSVIGGGAVLVGAGSETVAGVVSTAAGAGVVAGVVSCGAAVGDGPAGGGVVAASSATALAIPIEATRPSIVESPMPAVAIRAPCAGCRRGRRRGDGRSVADGREAREARAGGGGGGGSG